MTDSSEQSGQVKTELPGAPLSHFQAAVATIAEMRDQGKILVFLGAAGVARILVLSADPGAYEQEVKGRLKDDEVAPDPVKLLGEVEKAISARIVVDDPAQRLMRYTSALGLPAPGEEGPKQDHIVNKLKVVEKLVTPALVDRWLRLRSASTPCLEDLDAEIVQERQDRVLGLKTLSPFLRLRFRCREGLNAGEVGLLQVLLGITGRREHSFELECDLSDLDLLAQRIEEVRQLLVDAASPKEEADAT